MNNFPNKGPIVKRSTFDVFWAGKRGGTSEGHHDTFETQSPGVIKPCAAPRKNNFNLYQGVRFYCSEMIVCGMLCNRGGGL